MLMVSLAAFALQWGVSAKLSQGLQKPGDMVSSLLANLCSEARPLIHERKERPEEAEQPNRRAILGDLQADPALC